jgi:hypothetical protein
MRSTLLASDVVMAFHIGEAYFILNPTKVKYNTNVPSLAEQENVSARISAL